MGKSLSPEQVKTAVLRFLQEHSDSSYPAYLIAAGVKSSAGKARAVIDELVADGLVRVLKFPYSDRFAIASSQTMEEIILEELRQNPDGIDHASLLTKTGGAGFSVVTTLQKLTEDGKIQSEVIPAKIVYKLAD